MARVPSSPLMSLKESVPKLLPDLNKNQREKNEEEQVNFVLNRSEIDTNRRARKWRQYTKKTKRRVFRPPRSSPPPSNNERQWPQWQKEAADHYSDGEEEKFFGIPGYQYEAQ